MKSNPASNWDFPAVLLLYSIILFSALRVIATNWTTELNATLVLAFLGTGIGLALGFSRFRPMVANLLALGYSLLVIPWTIADIFYEQIPWLERILSILGRLGISLDFFFQKKPVEDTLLFIVFLSVTFWIISILAGYQWARHKNIALALLPAWVVMITIQVYDNVLNNHIYYLVFCMFFSLLLMGRKFILEKRIYWRENHIHTSVESGQDLSILLVVFSTVIILLTWAIPVNSHQIFIIKTAWDRISAPWQSARKDLGNAIAGLESNYPGSSNDLYGSDVLQLGQEATTGEAAIFSVTLPLDPFSSHHYWRVRTYDNYNNDQWSNGKHTTRVFEPYMPAWRLYNSSMSVTSEFNFTITQGRIFNLPIPAQTVWVSRPVNADIFQLPNGMLDPILLRADIVLHAGESYQVQAIESEPTILDLQRAGQNYPAWVVDRYLQRPANLSNRVKALASQLTAGKNNPYDKAVAITNYLRSEITYNKVVSSPPYGANLLEWFLLDYKQGYCNYYATAEVILLRAAGIPARMVVGFAQGEQMPEREDTYIIREKDAHAWPEAYFPGNGWVEFEPTTARPEIQRPTGIVATVTGNGSPSGNNSTETNGSIGTNQPPKPLPEDANSQPFGSSSNIPAWVYYLFGLLILGLGGFLFLRRHTQKAAILVPLPIRIKNTLERNSIKVPSWLALLADRAAEAPIQRSFNVIYKSLRRLGKPALPADTPQAICAVLMESLPVASQEIIILQDEYLKFMFSQHAADADTARHASIVIRKQTNRAVMINLVRRGFKPSTKKSNL